VIAIAVLAFFGSGFRLHDVAITVGERSGNGAAIGAAWPSGEIPIHNAAREDEQPFLAAVAAWNSSGADVHFRVVPERQAKVVVRRGSSSPCGPGAAGCAEIGYTGGEQSVVWLVQQLDQIDTTRVLVHELGHALGLTHVNGCAAMNPGWHGCPGPPAGDWRCRLLEAGDVARAIDLYGGRAKPLRTPAVCPLGEGVVASQSVPNGGSR
jgi:hypothetical protein